MNILGLHGYARSGKDAAAEALVAIGWERIAFADVLRDIAYATDPYVQVTQDAADSLQQQHPDEYVIAGDWYDEAGGEVFARLRLVVDTYGWEYAKEQFPDVRRLLQRLGTEGGRDILGENIWVDTAFGRARLDGAGLVITDVRFPNEAEAIKARGGKVVRISRPGIGPVNEHASDSALADYPFDHHIYNAGPLSELHDHIKRIANV